MRESVDRIVRLGYNTASRSMGPQKVFLVHVSDGQKMKNGLYARLKWARECRLFPFEEYRGGFLPMKQMVTAILGQLGFRGWVSLELFSRSTENKNPTTPAQHARRAKEFWRKLMREIEG